MTPLRLGLLSTAKINLQIIAAAAESDAVEIVAVGSRNGDRAQAYADEHGIRRAHGSYAELLADDALDAVYISLPNGMHHEWTLAALRAGKHVLCEKPYTRVASEAVEAWDEADAAGLVLMEAFMYRHHPQSELVARLVAEGAIGRLVAVKATFTFPLRNLSDVRAQPELDGGALLDIGSYCVSGTRLVAGEPERVLATHVTGETGIDMGLYGTMRFANDVVGQFEASFLAPQRQRLELVGADAVLLVESPWRIDWPGSLVIERDEQRETVDVPRANSYRLELENLAAAVAGEAPQLLGRADAVGQAKAIEALYRSAAEGREVCLG